MVLGVSAIFRASVGQHAAQPDLVLIIEGHHTVVEEIGRGERGLAIVELSEGDLGIGVDEGLLVDAPDPLHGADIEGVLGAAVAGTVSISVCGRRVEHHAAMALVKRSPKITANCALAMDHSRGGIFHSFSERFKTRNKSFIAASSALPA